jgi:hypothetical protein
VAQPTPSAKVRFLALPTRSQGQSLRPALGRSYAFASHFRNGRSWGNCRIPPSTQIRRIGLVRGAGRSEVSAEWDLLVLGGAAREPDSYADMPRLAISVVNV